MQTAREPMAHSNEMTALLNGLNALKRGKTGVRLPLEWTGVAGKVADAFNEVVELNERIEGKATGAARAAWWARKAS